MMRRLFILALTLLLWDSGAVAQDCNCAEVHLAEEVAATPRILTGKIIKADTVQITQDHQSDYLFFRYTVKVKEWLKGATTDRRITFYAGYSTCDYYFSKGRTYLLFMRPYHYAPPKEDNPYTRYFHDKYHVSECSRSALKKEAKALLPHIRDLL